MRPVKMMLVFVPLFALFIACSGDKNPTSGGSAPDGHTINKKGVMHKTGLSDPTVNCVQCHGADLKGGSAAVSCFECHGQKW